MTLTIRTSDLLTLVGKIAQHARELCITDVTIYGQTGSFGIGVENEHAFSRLFHSLAEDAQLGVIEYPAVQRNATKRWMTALLDCRGHNVYLRGPQHDIEDEDTIVLTQAVA